MEKKEISSGIWSFLIIGLWIVGVIIFSIANSTFFIPTEYTRAVWVASIGGFIIGLGFGLPLSRMFKVREGNR